VIGDLEALWLVDLVRPEQRTVIHLGGGWIGAARAGCGDWLLVDRLLRRERSLAFLDIRLGRLLPAELPDATLLAADPDLLDALAERFGLEAAFPEDRLGLGAVRTGPAGEPAIEVVARRVEPREPEFVIDLLTLGPPPPVRAAVLRSGRCPDPTGVAWLFRSPRAALLLPGTTPSPWHCSRHERSDEPPAPTPHDGPAGTSTGRGDPPPVIDFPSRGSVPLADAGTWTAWEACLPPDDRIAAVRVEHDGSTPFVSIHLLRPDGSTPFEARYADGDLDVVAVGTLAGDAVVAGNADGWLLCPPDAPPTDLGLFPPVLLGP
jgi:hypothetical protein